MKLTLGRVAVGLLVAISLTLAVLLLVFPRVAGYRTYVVTGRSMTGTISIGSLVYSDPVPVQSLRVGDIITFVPPDISENVTHRIVGLRTTSDGMLRISTKGDAVPTKDPWEVTPTTAELPREVMAIPYLGYLAAVLSLRLVRVLLFALPAMVAAMVVLVRLWRESDEAPAVETSAAGASSPPVAPADPTTGPADAVAIPVRVWEALPVRRALTALVVLAALTALAVAAAVQRSSGAVFSRTSDSSVQATADHVHSWLHAYSQSTDPDGLTGYALRRNSSPSVPAATGVDEEVAVHLGGYTATTTVNRVITIKTPTAFPDTTVTSVTVTASLVADPTTGKQPINAIGFAAVGGTGRTNPVTLAQGVKDQLNLRVSVTGLALNSLYVPTVKITVAFTGFTTAYYVYSIPVKVYYGTGPGPN